MAKEKNDYFSMMVEMADCSLQAAVELETILADFNIDRLKENMDKLHAIEHQGDQKRHVLAEKLMKEFITPIEREDIMAITNQIDNVTDAVEDVLLKIYMYNIQEIEPESLEFVGLIRRCCQYLKDMFREFGNYKKSKTLFDTIVTINGLEEEGDALYIRLVHDLHSTGGDARKIAVWTDIYHCMERVCDTCEQTGELVQHVIMKNT